MFLVRRFPQEILDLIVDAVAQNEDTTYDVDSPGEDSLRALSLACRATSGRSQKHIFSSIVVTYDTVLRLHATLLNSPHLAKYTKEFTIQEYREAFPVSTCRDPLQFIMASFHGLTRLNLWHIMSDAWDFSSCLPSTLPSLRTLQICGCTLPSHGALRRIVDSMPQGGALYLEDVSFLECPVKALSNLDSASWSFSDLDLFDYCLDEPEDVVIASMIKSVDHLDMEIKDWVDLRLFHALMHPSKGLKKLTLGVYWALNPDEIGALYDDDASWRCGLALEWVTLRALADEIEPGEAEGDGRWATRFLLAVNSEKLSTVHLRISDSFVVDSPGSLWPGFDWAAVDEVLSSKIRYPTLKHLAILSTRRWGCFSKQKELDELLWNLLPMSAERGILCAKRETGADI
ncbi:hypothetical protein PUNSTDRAFT_138429 [Punctularia strigosozonata HHB-11173 SS5]|uniref:F-box domain-containing protein n=1 Tax=Punctularia strigosozonata (strain HHB-11173) TaxID=741275 RepID=R7S4L1_PUNST|nr:uncharacterized protein PUNSTDRAFT_138429 [Punctularia strigosozonata HHB-11173 SS5]EIN04784.1 hypothetical protein PUNSTDRAFT_138429 [Punctularia strigosozonata HHB-11173 SS5]